MKKLQQVALVGAGKLTDSPLARLRNLGSHLGPVKAPSLRVASRIANTLRAGYAVDGYAGFESCPLVLISVPGRLLASTVDELALAPFSWLGKLAVLCSNEAGCNELAPLAELGAVTGSLACVPGSDDQWFVLEGSKLVERSLRPLIVGRGERVTLIGTSQKNHYLSALACLSARLSPLLQEASESLKHAQVPNLKTVAIIEKQVSRTMRSYFRSGKPA